MSVLSTKLYQMTTSDWKTIQGWPSYQVSDQGQVRSVDREFKDSLGRGRSYKGRLLKQRLNDSGYLYVELNSPEKQKKVTVHILVAQEFIPKLSADLVVCHGPNGKLDNSVSNLRWDTQSNNIFDSVREKTHVSARKERCPLGAMLREPNLTRSDAARGQRGCLACSRTRNYVRHQKERGNALTDLDRERIHEAYAKDIFLSDDNF